MGLATQRCIERMALVGLSALRPAAYALELLQPAGCHNFYCIFAAYFMYMSVFYVLPQQASVHFGIQPTRWNCSSLQAVAIFIGFALQVRL